MITIKDYESVICAVCRVNYTTKTLEVETLKGNKRSFPCCLSCRASVEISLQEEKETLIENAHVKRTLVGREAKETQVLPPANKVFTSSKSSRSAKLAPPPISQETLDLIESLR